MLTQSQAKALVQRGIERGWIRLPSAPKRNAVEDEYRRRIRLCMARLRAEQKSEDTSRFPPRVRKKRCRKSNVSPT